MVLFSAVVFIPRHTIVVEYYGFKFVISLGLFCDFFFSLCYFIVGLYYGTELVILVTHCTICTNVHLSYVHLLNIHQFIHCMSILSLFLDNNLSNYHWIFTTLVMCIDVVEIGVVIADGQISSVFDRVICLPHISAGVLSFQTFIFILQRSN